MDPNTQALPALLAADAGHTADAQADAGSARRRSRRAARRHRQIAEIAALVVADNLARAAGLGLEHTAEFPEDADLVARVGA